MAFNADAYIEAAYTPPEFTFRGRVHRGRVLSTEEWARLQAEKNRQLAGTPTAAQARRFTRECIRSWFPRPWWLAWLGPFAPSAAWRAFKRMPDAAQVKAVVDFSLSQRKAVDLIAEAIGPDAGQPTGT